MYEDDFEIKKIVNMNYQPLVSIVIPVYKGYPYLRNAIQSCLDQTYKNIEIIVVNDGSPDGGRTKAIAQSFGDKIRYFEKANGGVSTALNYGISQMKGEWFSWLSHDDLYLPDKIEKQLDVIGKETDKICVVRCTTMSVDENEKPLFRPQRKIKGVFTAAQMMRLHSLKEVGLYGCALLIHRKILEVCGNFDDTLRTVQDEDYWNRIMFKGYRFISVPDILVKIRIHTLQTTNLLSDKFVEERVILTDRVIDYYNEDRKRNYSLLLTFCQKQYKERRKDLGERVYIELKKNDDFALRNEVSIRMYSCYGIFYALMKKVYRHLFIKPNR